MKLFTLDNIRKALGIIFMLTGGFYVVYASLGLSENYYFDNQVFSLLYGISSIVAGYGIFKRLTWGMYGFGVVLMLELAGEYFYTESGVGFSDIFFFFAGFAALYFIFVKK